MTYMEQKQEMTFIDLCVACGNAIGRACAALWRLFAHMLRLTYRYWWLVVTLLILAVSAALYYTREENITYKMNAVALLNGPSVQQFEQAYAPLRSGKNLPAEAQITSFWKELKATRFDAFRVIDAMDDGVADYIDFKRQSTPRDTVDVQMQDRLCLQFRIKARNMHLVPEIEKSMLDFLNANDALQQSFENYRKNITDEVAFNHSQAVKLDSLTTHYYFHGHPGREPLAGIRDGLVFMGDWRVHLFLTDIYDHQKHLQLRDYRALFATAPVVLENHFSADPKPVNGRRKTLAMFLILGWIGGCALAEIIDKRKALLNWLKKE